MDTKSICKDPEGPKFDWPFRKKTKQTTVFHGNLRYPPKATPLQEIRPYNKALLRETNG